MKPASEFPAGQPRPGDRTGLTAAMLAEYGLSIEARNTIDELRFERPAFVGGHRLKQCTIGAFAYLNAAGATSVYRCRIGRYAQIGESSIIGPPEHPMDYFSTHPFAFSRPAHLPGMYRFPDFARLSPDADAGPSWVESQPLETVIGHEAYVGVGSFVRRGVTIGDGAVIGARSVVTRDVPPFAIAVGSPARVQRLRFSETLIERFQKLAWWRYDLAPFKRQVDYAQVERTLAFFEQKAADGELALLQPPTYLLRRDGEHYALAPQSAPLY